MALLDDALGRAQSALGKGVAAAHGAVSGVALENVGFVRRFVRMCDDGWQQGWHECNGGNATYRLSFDEAVSVRPFLAEVPDVWTDLGVSAPSLGGATFLATAAGSFMRNVALDPDRSLGLVELNAAGDAYRMVWGFRDGGAPTSEFAGHVLIHEARMLATSGTSRVVYHAHPTPVIVLSKLLPCESEVYSRVLLDAMTECSLVFPEGVGAVGRMTPGSLELARASAQEMARFRAVVWAHHGLLCAGETCDDAFGLMHVIAKAAEICVWERAASRPSAPPAALPGA